MPRQRFLRLPAHRRKEVLSAAADEFAERGYDGASIGRIVAASGASKGALYYWFDDKQDLFAHTAVIVLAPLAAAIGKPGPVGSEERFWTAVTAMCERGWAYLKEHEPALRMLRAVVRARAGGELGERWREMSAPAEAAAAEVVLLGQAVGAVREDVPMDLLFALAVGVLQAADSWFEDRVDELDESEVQAALDAVLDTLQRLARQG